MVHTTQKIYIQSAVLALSYELTESLGLRFDFKHTFLTTGDDTDSFLTGTGIGYSLRAPKFTGYGLSINCMFRYPLSGFSLYVIPGLGISKYSQYEDGGMLYRSYVHYNPGMDWRYYQIYTSENAYTYFAKMELGVAAYISRYVEFYLSLGVDYHFFSKLITDVRFHQISGPIYNLMEELPIQNKYSGNMPPEYYIMTGLTFRMF